MGGGSNQVISVEANSLRFFIHIINSEYSLVTIVWCSTKLYSEECRIKQNFIDLGHNSIHLTRANEYLNKKE